MKISQYYVHFENPQPLDNIEATIFALDPDAHIKGNLESVKEPFDPDDQAY